MTDKRLRAIERDEKFLARLYWELRQQSLDSLEVMLEIGISGSDNRYQDEYSRAKDYAFAAFFYAGSN